MGPDERNLVLPPYWLFVAVVAAGEGLPEDPATPPFLSIHIQGAWPPEEIDLGFLPRQVLHDGGHLQAAALDVSDEAFH